jgi:hypothetical protein
MGWKNGSLFILHIDEWMILKYILKELGCDCVSWIYLAWVGDRWEASVNTIMNLSSHQVKQLLDQVNNCQLLKKYLYCKVTSVCFKNISLNFLVNLDKKGICISYVLRLNCSN